MPIFSSYRLESFEKIKQLALSSPKSTHQADPVHSNLSLHCIDIIVPTTIRLINLSLSTDIFPSKCISAFVKLLLKLKVFDSHELKNYCSILKLFF